MNVFIMFEISIPPINPATIAAIIIAKSTFILHKHNTQSRITDIITGLKIILICLF